MFCIKFVKLKFMFTLVPPKPQADYKNEVKARDILYLLARTQQD